MVLGAQRKQAKGRPGAVAKPRIQGVPLSDGLGVKVARRSIAIGESAPKHGIDEFGL